MKRTKFLFIILLGSVFSLTNCNQKKVSELETKNSELTTQIELMDSSMTAYLQTFLEIEENLSAIKVKQNLISTMSSDEIEFNEEVGKRMVDDLKVINDLMSENNQKIERLQGLVDESNFQIEEFRRLLANVNRKLKEKDEEIKSLNKQLDFTLAENQELKDDMLFLSIKVDTLTAVNKTQMDKIIAQEKIIDQNEHELNAGFVATGTLKELEDKNIVVKEGGILGLRTVTKLNEEVSKDDFLKIDITKTQTIPLMVKKVKVITDHPSDSYTIEESENGRILSNLVITNPDRFWNTSKFLVVRVN